MISELFPAASRLDLATADGQRLRRTMAPDASLGGSPPTQGGLLTVKLLHRDVSQLLAVAASRQRSVEVIPLVQQAGGHVVKRHLLPAHKRQGAGERKTSSSIPPFLS